MPIGLTFVDWIDINLVIHRVHFATSCDSIALYNDPLIYKYL